LAGSLVPGLEFAQVVDGGGGQAEGDEGHSGLAQKPAVDLC
jgi:hypothetical protein